MSSLIRLSMAVVVFASLLAAGASADPWREGRALITCYPGTGHFELQTKQAYRDNIAPERGEIVRPQSYLSQELEDHPFVCELPGQKIVVEGRNRVDGKGYCGLISPSDVRVLINDVPVAYKFDEIPGTETSSIHKLSEGWIELSDCFEEMQSVTVYSSETSLRVELCRVQKVGYEPGQKITQLAGNCKIWPNLDPTYRKK